MHSFLYIEINIFAIIISFIIYLNINHRSDKYMPEQKLFAIILGLNISILIFDTLMWALDGKDNPFYHTVLLLSTLIYFLLQPIICLFWYFYVDFQINRKSSRFKKILLLIMIPYIIYTVLVFFSITGNYIFYFDGSNVYHRGHYFMVLPVFCFLLISYTSCYLILNKNRIQKAFFPSFLSFALWPIIGGLIQTFYYGVSLIWVGMTISIFVIFVNIQNEQMYNDYLTGLFNRRQLDLYLQDIIQKKKGKVAGILLDINSFKSINDQYGHLVGDEALKITSNLLKKSFSHNSYIFRLGGDEFVILIDADQKTELDHAINKLQDTVHQFNLENTLPYKLEYSIGADLYPKDSNISGEEFLRHIDMLMYKQKLKR